MTYFNVCPYCNTKLRSITPDNRMMWKDKRVCIHCFKKLNSQGLDEKGEHLTPQSARAINGNGSPISDAAVEVRSGND